jgi:hypothetical protein
MRLTSESSGQQRITQGDEDLALWTKGKKNMGRGARKGAKGGTKPEWSGVGKE